MICIDVYSTTIEQQIHTDAILSRQLHEEHVQFRRLMSHLTENKATEYFDKRGTLLSQKQGILVGNNRLEQLND